ncbi:biotin/lipoyl-containing protein, partial [Paracoccus sp. 22332]|uniref:biotin/lipoyl-containing protein n=1 Tax=Paracoccus sp. 22332 TaxID=3453913 RepID=UPI003F829B0A
NAGHVGAPMPGVVASVAATAGAKVRQGDLLLTIEAMKMETGLHADRDGTIKAVHVRPGEQIDAKDLLVEVELAATDEATQQSKIALNSTATCDDIASKILAIDQV